ncbi:MAG: STAS-like domain-containing protein [Elusimicrobiota bacterium]|jgi:hypothetical protein|nr:STAS-like domain-containing protein [Elusimicrobiota bacterium]
MTIKISKFGTLLLSRADGREAFLAAKAYSIKAEDKEIILDFSEVEVLTPSWAGEFINGIKQDFANIPIKYENDTAPSIKESLEIVKN